MRRLNDFNDSRFTRNQNSMPYALCSMPFHIFFAVTK
jgi:hypothetical protein